MLYKALKPFAILPYLLFPPLRGGRRDRVVRGEKPRKI